MNKITLNKQTCKSYERAFEFAINEGDPHKALTVYEAMQKDGFEEEADGMYDIYYLKIKALVTLSAPEFDGSDYQRHVEA